MISQRGLSGKCLVKTIYFVNSGDSSVSPAIICSSNMRLENSDGKQYVFNAGTNEDFELSFSPGINYFTVYGNGTISAHYNIEVMA